MKKVFTLLLLTSIMFACVHLKSVPLDKSESSNNGFYYTLPKTYINTEFSLKQTKTTKGIYFKYAECLGVPKGILNKINDNTTYTIDKVSITNNAYLDDNAIYQLDFNQKFLNKSDFKLEYASNGELSSAELSNESQIIPAVITTLNIVSDIAGGASFFLGTTDSGTVCVALPEFVKNELKNLNDVNKAITNLLSKGPDGISKEQLEYRVKELNKIKSNIVSKFTATVKTKTIKYSFEFDPEKISSPVNILKYVKIKGFERLYDTNPHDNNKPNTEKLPFNHSFSSTDKTSTVSLNLVYANTSISQAIDVKKGGIEEGSFYYRVPANVKYKVMMDNKNLSEATLAIPQMGKIFAAPKKLKNITFKLYPGLGSIYTVSGKTDSLHFGEIDSLRSSIFGDKNAEKIKTLKEAIEIKELEEKLKGGNEEVDEIEDN
tara:strand:+ start:1476 stop:2774 length:1299 start_codon:yes stop_codon:yes gene_type:complete